MSYRGHVHAFWLICVGILLVPFGGVAQEEKAPAPAAASEQAPLQLVRLTGEITVDGDLSDAAWAAVPAVTEWWETNPGDNLPASVRNVARLAYDDKYLYAAFEFDEADPSTVRAPFGDHDQLGGQTDYGGILLDARNDGKTAQMFLANANGVLYDAITSDATGEDSSPDFFWESVGKITASGYTLEMRIPFSSIRYTEPNPKQWGILLYRNRPRDFRYQYFSSRLPKEKNCFICNVQPIEGMADLPTGSHYVVAPYVTAGYGETPSNGLGSPLVDDGGEFDAGVDLKWIPNPDTVLDATVNPDFSQIESDTAQITANERFAIFQPERRPFFLESVDLFSTPLQAVYTRTITDVGWGARATGDVAETKYTFLLTDDQGGGSVVIPGSNGSSFADQEFDSIVALGRVRRDFGRSFASLLYSGREIDGGGSNRVFGPDFQWRPNDNSSITGQLLWSATDTPDRPDLAAEWDGRSQEGHAARLQWSWSDGKWDYYASGIDVDEDFRAYNGFVTQAGHRTFDGEAGYTFRPEEGAVRRLRLFSFARHSEDEDGNLLEKRFVPGFGMDAALNSFIRLEVGFEELRAETQTFERIQLRPEIEIRPSKIFSRIYLQGRFGEEIDFANDREADRVVSFVLSGEISPTERLRLSPSYGYRTLDVTTADGRSGQLFKAQVARLRALYSFSPKSWIRLIGQWVDTERRPELWTFPVDRRSGDFAGSLVFAYKLNWQTVLYVGVADNRVLDLEEQLEPVERQAFFKISYAFRD